MLNSSLVSRARPSLKALTMSDLRPVFYGPGIYAITCAVDNKTYVGQSKNISKRWATHVHQMNEARKLFLVNPYTSPDLLWHSWNVHGPEMHQFSVLEPIDDPAKLTARERYWITTLNTLDERYGFNKMLPL
jgi:group I intron endonuclease